MTKERGWGAEEEGTERHGPLEREEGTRLQSKAGPPVSQQGHVAVGLAGTRLLDKEGTRHVPLVSREDFWTWEYTWFLLSC